MSATIQRNELKLYFSSVSLLAGIRQKDDERTAADAIGDLEVMLIHSENPVLRRKISEALNKHKAATGMQPAVEMAR